ncbi:hypothetical protein JYG23_09495 [Sedimentibacter sp. zth1]|uniref:hypothetical protein n=1 Tax=Sedimentibacter sp. zth1 TaxID=2816908 RepID=UPI001A92C18B|nr:hypothetical protein [Sedimentibacter sp. zth1]QSX04925.1 hypothetical protein JYG23_09495 [Sedimentibacter sp. zth1]
MNYLFNSDDIYGRDSDVAIFDYSAQTSNSIITNNKSECVDKIFKQSSGTNCLNYSRCLQYFNTLPYEHCNNNVPDKYLLIEEDKY